MNSLLRQPKHLCSLCCFDFSYLFIAVEFQQTLMSQQQLSLKRRSITSAGKWFFFELVYFSYDNETARQYMVLKKKIPLSILRCCQQQRDETQGQMLKAALVLKHHFILWNIQCVNNVVPCSKPAQSLPDPKPSPVASPRAAFLVQPFWHGMIYNPIVCWRQPTLCFLFWPQPSLFSSVTNLWIKSDHLENFGELSSNPRLRSSSIPLSPQG